MHGLETRTDESGTVRTLAAFREAPAWHGLGEVFEGSVTTAQMLEKAGLGGWDVRLVENVVRVGSQDVVVPDRFAVIRNNPFTPEQIDGLSVVGSRYVPVQNEDAFAFADGILDGGGEWESAGSIRDGRVVFGSLVMPREVVLDPQGANDKVVTYLLVNTSHDGTTGVQATVTPTRVVCQNTLSVALKGANRTFKIRHTTSVEGRLAEAREALNITYSYMDGFEEDVRRLFETPMDLAAFTKLATTVYPKPESEAKQAQTRWENKIDLLGDLFVGKTNENIAGTAWAGLNAMTEALDWYRTARGGGDGVLEAASGFVPAAQVEKDRVWSAVKELVLA